MKYLVVVLFALMGLNCFAQELKLPERNLKSLTGSQFAQSIAASSLSLVDREEIIYKEIKKGNIPDFLRKLQLVKIESGDLRNSISYHVLPDYFCIGSDEDFFYVPMTPNLAQRIAKLANCSLPTRKMVNQIYEQAVVKLSPQPIPPSEKMVTIQVFIAHTDSIRKQLEAFELLHVHSALTAGNKKDIVISNRIYGESSPRVVIYGWHQLNGKAIQPLYNKHTNTWVDYSHGIRLISNKIVIRRDGIEYRTTIKKVLNSLIDNHLLSDEGVIAKPYYPIK